MLRPSGEALMTTTSAPASRSAAGPTSLAAPFAQSTAIRRPVERGVDRADEVLDVRGAGAARCRRGCGRRRRRAAAPSPRRCAPRWRPRASSSSLCPPRARNLMPLSGIGLCDADSTTPMSTPSVGGQVRDRRRRQHADVVDVDARRREARARPPRRGTRPTRASRGRRRRAAGAPRTRPRVPSTCAAATDRSSASSAVTSRLASPRTPSVPNSRPMSDSFVVRAAR